MIKCGIYKITNVITKKVYIGQSIDIYRRWWEHKARYNNSDNNCYDKPLYRAMRKYGLKNFQLEILEECTPEELNSKEIGYIQSYNSITPNGYNVAFGTDKNPTNIQYCSRCGSPINKQTKHGLCLKCYNIAQQKVLRPSAIELKQLLQNYTFVAVGKKYGVSDNAIRKWCKAYGLSTHTKDYK